MAGLPNPPNPAAYTATSDNFTLNNPTKANHDFVGWTGSNGNTPQLTVTIAKGSYGNLAYMAHWRRTPVPDTDSSAAPSAPRNLTATPGNEQITLSWAAPASNGGSAITKYEVSIDNGRWVEVTGTSYTFTGLVNGRSCSFRVRALNANGVGIEASVIAAAGKAYSMQLQTPASGAQVDPNNGKDIVFYIPEGVLGAVVGLRINGVAIPLNTTGLPSAITFSGGKMGNGSVTVTLYNSTLKTYADGVHRIEVLFADGTAMIDFTIQRADPSNDISVPQTGDDTGPSLWWALFAGGLMLGGIGAARRRRFGQGR